MDDFDKFTDAEVASNTQLLEEALLCLLPARQQRLIVEQQQLREWTLALQHDLLLEFQTSSFRKKLEQFDGWIPQAGEAPTKAYLQHVGEVIWCVFAAVLPH